MGKLKHLKNALDNVKKRRAYHGTPHDFDTFDVKKIGTGEGAQAYGHGLYFTSKEDIAKYYRDALGRGWKPGDSYVLDGEDLTDVYERFRDAGDYDRALMVENILLHRSKDDVIRAAIDDEAADDAIEWARSLPDDLFAQPEGRVFTVEIPDESLMLDWDLPLSEQPENVRGALNTALTEKIGNPMTADWETAEWLQREGTGKQIYEYLSREGGEVDSLNVQRGNQAAASAHLRELGIPGITYKGATSGERNFVVFDDEHVDILEKAAIAPVGLAAQDFVSRRQESNAMWEGLQAGGAIASGIAGGVVSDLSRLGGYLNPMYDVETSERAADELGQRMQYVPENNQYLNKVAEWMGYLDPYVERAEKAWPHSIPGQVYESLPPRVRGLVKSAADWML